jgi:hypothetical protein
MERKNMTMENKVPIDPDLAGVDKALKRAAKSALALARKTKTSCYVVEDGKLVDIAAAHLKSAAVKRPPKTA